MSGWLLFLWVWPAVMRNDETRKGADYSCKSNPCDAEFLLHVLEQGTDLLDGLLEPVFVGFEGPRPEMQRFGPGLYLRGIRGCVFHVSPHATRVPSLQLLDCLVIAVLQVLVGVGEPVLRLVPGAGGGLAHLV